MQYKIISDSSCNVLTMPREDFATVPLKILAAREYVDDAALDVDAMIEDLKNYKGKSSSSCPNVGEWLEAFGDGEFIFGITITKHLSGSYNAAVNAAQTYMREHPGRKVFIFDSLSAGPELMLLVEKIRACEAAGDDFETTKEKVLDYHNHLHTLFSLESLTNLARNGRINPAVAKIASVLGIRVVGEASGGQLSLVHKPRGPRKTTSTLVSMMKERGFAGGRLRVSHCRAEEAVLSLRDAVLAQFPGTNFSMEPTTALCSYYAEEGGFIIAMEGSFNNENDNHKF